MQQSRRWRLGRLPRLPFFGLPQRQKLPIFVRGLLGRPARSGILWGVARGPLGVARRLAQRVLKPVILAQIPEPWRDPECRRGFVCRQNGHR